MVLHKNCFLEKKKIMHITSHLP